MYERLEGDAEDVRGTGELYGCARLETSLEDQIAVRTKLKYAVPDTAFSVYVKVGDEYWDAQANPILVGELTTTCIGQAEGEFDVDVSTYAGPEIFVQVVVEPVDVSTTLGYTSDTVSIMLQTDE